MIRDIPFIRKAFFLSRGNDMWSFPMFFLDQGEGSETGDAGVAGCIGLL